MKKYAAEFIAVFFLVFVGTAAIVTDQYLAVVQLRDTFGVLGVALAHGLALALAIAAVGRISGGHVNPAISIAFFVARRLSLKDLAGYIAAQLLGGLTASLMVAQLFPADTVSSVSAGVPGLGDGVQVLQGGLIEVVLAFMLAFVFWGTAVDPKGPKAIAPLAIGLTVTFDMLAGAPFTGAAMNPARWFGPAVVSNTFAADSIVWILGPIVGALIASTVYELFFLDEQLDNENEAEGEKPAGDDDRGGQDPAHSRKAGPQASGGSDTESGASAQDSG
ncbi:MAG: aquaporin [Actinomycetota bacterium]